MDPIPVSFNKKEDMRYNSIQGKLGFIQEYLPDNMDTIIERLRGAYKLLIPQKADCFSNNDIFGINQCIHLATSIVFLGANSKSLKALIEELKNGYECVNDENVKETIKFKSDPTTIITVAALYSLLLICKKDERFCLRKISVPKPVVQDKAPQTEERNAPQKIDAELKTIAQDIQDRLEEVNWMIGDGDMKLLGIGEKYDKEAHANMNLLGIEIQTKVNEP